LGLLGKCPTTIVYNNPTEYHKVKTLKLHIMQQSIPLESQVLRILQQIDAHLNRKEFCELHQISPSKLSRVLSGKIPPSFEMLDYLAMHTGKKLIITLK
jgi:transcriptional regulator with XRE-family HTH domain